MEKILTYITNVNDDTTYPKIDENSSLQEINDHLRKGWVVKSVTSAGATYASAKSSPNPTAAAFLTVVVLVQPRNEG